MSASEILSMISLISFILAGISAVLAVIFWIRFNIPVVIGDLSGRTARKSIEKMRANNEKSGRKDFAPSKTNLNRGKLTDLMKQSETLVNKKKEENVIVEEQPETGLLMDGEMTELLQGESMETGLLGTELLEEIEVSEETGLLVEGIETIPFEQDRTGFVMLDEVILVHTKEIIT